MSSGLTADLALAGALVFFACWLLLSRAVGWRAALVLAVLRVGLCVTYFAAFDDGSWRLLDDLHYTEDSLLLDGALGGFPGLWRDPDAGLLLGAVAGGTHVGYFAHNLLAFELFGEHYWSPVLLNVFLSCVAALGLLAIARQATRARADEIGGSESERTARAERWLLGLRLPLVAGFLLHPDVIAWSGFFNLKDTLVLTFSTWLLACTAALLRGLRTGTLTAAVLLALGLSVTRSYAVVLIGLAVLAWVALHGRARVRVLLAGLACAALPFVPRAGLENFQPTQAPAGLVEFLLTPRPWGISRDYEFLTVSAGVHWLLFPVALWGALWLWRRGGRLVRLPLLYGAVLVAFYACVPLLAGPRHRYQMVFVLVGLQGAGLYALAREGLAGRLGPRRVEDPQPGSAGGDRWSASST